MEMEGGFVKELADICHARGCLVMVHNCGEKIYFDVQIETMNPCAISFFVRTLPKPRPNTAAKPH
jgi:uroporphyrinogen decarboxylase